MPSETVEELRIRAELLREAAEEFEYLQMVLYLYDEGFIEIDPAGGLWEKEGTQLQLWP